MRTSVLGMNFGMAAGLALWLGMGVGRCTAGPARYDPETRSIRFNYTYAALTEGQFGDAAIGAPQEPKSEQDALVRTVVLKVSDALSKATAGRIKIASLDLVSDVKQADVVISLTGKPARGGWAMTGAIEGRPGQIGLYYQTLADEWEQDVVLTAAHEVCHYIFGFTDEYNFPNGCPRENPGGPGCLMDNYLSQGTRHGWYGRLCSTDHVRDRSQPRSCQDIADDFFRDRGVTDTDQPGTPAVAGADPERNRSVVENLQRATIGKVREEAEARMKGKRGAKVLTSVTALRGVARTFIQTQLEQNKIGLSSDEVKGLVDGALRQAASLVKVTVVPPPFQPLVTEIGNLAKLKAEELRQKFPKDSETTRRQKVVKALVAFVAKFAAGNAPGVGRSRTEQREYLEHVAMQAVIQADESELNGELFQAAMAKLNRETAGTVLDIASEVGVVGMENRLAAIGEIDADLRKVLPGRTAATGFGRRRTMIIDPDPLDPRKDFVVSDSGIHRYSDLRDEYVQLFSRLVERAKVELLITEEQRRRQDARRQTLASGLPTRLFQERLRRIAELADRDRVRGQREADLRALLREASLQVRSNRLENIVFLVPPGGLPADLGPVFEALRRQLIIKGDVRLDIVQVNASEVPHELRDIAIGTGGSIVTILDIDEVGAVAQRLRNEQTSGAWVILPHQDEIRGRGAADANRRDGRQERWLLGDDLGGRFIGDPIEGPYRDLKMRLAGIDAYFSPARANEDSPAEKDLIDAGIMPLGAIQILADSMRYALKDIKSGSPPEGRDREPAPDALDSQSSSGLQAILRYLDLVIDRYNNRKPGTGGEVQFDILEHIVRARALYEEIRALLDLALSTHERALAPDFGEDDLFSEAYGEDIKKRQDRDIEAIGWKLGLAGLYVQMTGDPEGALAQWAAEEELKVERRKTPFLKRLDIIQLALDKELAKPYDNATKTYIKLKKQEVQLRAVNEFLDHLEGEIAGMDKTQLFRRIDRNALVQANRRIAASAPGFVASVPGAVSRPPLPPVDTVDENGRPRPGAYRLPRFYAENVRFDPKRQGQAEFEFIIGLSQPLPGLDDTALRDNRTDVIPDLRLYNDNGQLVNTPSLRLDRDLSTRTCLIYRFSPEFGETGWYTGALILKPLNYRRLGSDTINFTFSVASTRPNFRLNASLVQLPNDPELIPPPPNRGLARVMDRRAKVEVQVYGGTSVLGAQVRGVLHKLDQGAAKVDPIAQDFHDDGKTYGDLKADDGIYTTIIALDQIARGMEYRVLIQAESTPLSKNIPPEDPNKNDVERRQKARDQGFKDVREEPTEKVESPKAEPATVFQRATSIQIRVDQ